MAIRLTTTLNEDTSAWFSPGTDIVVQIDSAKPVIIDVLVKMDAALNPAVAVTFNAYDLKVIRLPQVPFMAFKVRDNKAANTVQIWDNS